LGAEPEAAAEEAAELATVEEAEVVVVLVMEEEMGEAEVEIEEGAWNEGQRLVMEVMIRGSWCVYH
jgi:hypothetical protein